MILVVEVPICAALLLPDGYVIRGHRHDDCYLVLLGLRKRDDLKEPRYDKATAHEAIQGFMTSGNRFVDRKEAAKLMREARWPNPRTGEPFDADILFSEDLY